MITKFYIPANELMAARNVDIQKIQGFAIELSVAGAAKAVDGVDTLPALPDSLRNPCINCQFLMGKLKCNPTNFMVSNFEEYEPTAIKQASSNSQGSGNDTEPTANKTASGTSQASGNKAIPTANKTTSGASQDLGNPLVGASVALIKGVMSAKPPKT